jgi:hypothetical protein
MSLPLYDYDKGHPPAAIRHTFSVTTAQKEIGLPALQRLLGQDHLATTEIYLNLSPEHVIKGFMEKWSWLCRKGTKNISLQTAWRVAAKRRRPHPAYEPDGRIWVNKSSITFS